VTGVPWGTGRLWCEEEQSKLVDSSRISGVPSGTPENLLELATTRGLDGKRYPVERSNWSNGERRGWEDFQLPHLGQLKIVPPTSETPVSANLGFVKPSVMFSVVVVTITDHRPSDSDDATAGVATRGCVHQFWRPHAECDVFRPFSFLHGWGISWRKQIGTVRVVAAGQGPTDKSCQPGRLWQIFN
jgi:hypothetical protein